MSKKKMVVILNVDEEFANAEGIAAGISGAYSEDDVTVDEVTETQIFGDEVVGLTAIALIADVELYGESNGITFTEDEKVDIANKIADSESFAQFVNSEIQFWNEQEDEE